MLGKKKVLKHSSFHHKKLEKKIENYAQSKQKIGDDKGKSRNQ